MDSDRDWNAKTQQLQRKGSRTQEILPVLRARCLDTGAWGTQFHLQHPWGGGFPPELGGGGFCGFVVLLGEFELGEVVFGEFGFWEPEFGELEFGEVELGEFEFGEFGFVEFGLFEFWFGEFGLFGEFEFGEFLPLGEFVVPGDPPGLELEPLGADGEV
jgi:hypothetical protein